MSATLVIVLLAASVFMYPSTVAHAEDATYNATLEFEGTATSACIHDVVLDGDTEFVLTEGQSSQIVVWLNKNNPSGTAAYVYLKIMYDDTEMCTEKSLIKTSLTFTKTYSDIKSTIEAKDMTTPTRIGASYSYEIVNNFNMYIILTLSDKDPKPSEITIPETFYTKLTTDTDFDLGVTHTGDGTLTYESSNPSVATLRHPLKRNPANTRLL